MISMFCSPFQTISAFISQPKTGNPRARVRFAMAKMAVLLALLCARLVAAGQTAHFDGAQTMIVPSVDNGVAIGTDILAIAVDSAGDVIFTTQNPEMGLASQARRGARYVPAALHSSSVRRLTDGRRDAAGHKVNASTCYQGPGSALYVRLASTGTVYMLGGSIGLNAPTGLALDSSGNLYVLDAYTGAIYKFLGAGGSVQIVSTNGNSAIGDGPFLVTQVQGNGCTGGDMAMDASGDLYYSTAMGNAVEEIPAVNGILSPSMTRSLGSGFDVPCGIAVDTSGNVYVANFLNNTVEEIVAVGGSIPASPTIRILGSGYNMPAAVAVDSRGDVYVTDYNNNALKEILAVDGSIPSSPTIETLGTFGEASAVVLDGSGDIFVADSVNNGANVIELTPTGNFGQVNVGATSSSAISMAFTFDSGGTLGGISVLTQGTTGLDYANAGTGTCTAGTMYAAGQSCTVNVTFTPQFAGTRHGAVVLADNNGNTIASGYVQGRGAGPQIAFLPGTQSAVGSGFIDPMAVAVDSGGDVFVGDENTNSVYEVVAVNGSIPALPTINTLASGFQSPWGLAVDGAGNLFVADFGKNEVYEILKAGGYTTVITLGGGFYNPSSVAVDDSDNIFVADYGNNAVKEIPFGCVASSCVKTLGYGFNGPSGLALDSSANVFVVDSNNRAVKEILATGGYTTVNTLYNGLMQYAWGLTVDGSGNVYVPNSPSSSVIEILAGGGYSNVQTLTGNFNHPDGVAVDGYGNVFVADTGNNRIAELDFSNAPSLSFASTVVGSTSSDSPQTVTIANVGKTPLTFPILSAGDNPSIAANFSLNDNANNACPVVSSSSSEPGTLAAGASCALSISFNPAAAGSFSGSLVLTDNNLNAAAPGYASQAIQLSGTGTLTPSFSLGALPASLTVIQGTTGASTITVSAQSGFTDSVTLAASGLPSGVTASFGTNPTTGTSTLWLTASSTATVGTTTVAITGTSGTLTATTTIALTVNPAPTFTLGASPASLTIVQGATGTSTITVSGQNGLAGSVTLAASGLPPGVTASFVPNPTTGTSALTLSASGSAATVTVNVTITGTSGALAATANVALTVIAPPGFTPPSVNFGSWNIGTLRLVQMTYTFGSQVTLGSTAVLTQGATGLDFADLGVNDTCANMAYTAGQSCTINVTFTPKFAGARYGAVVLNDNNGNVIATAHLQGMGVGPQINFLPGTESTVGGFNTPTSVAVDGSGNVYVADYGNNAVKEIMAINGNIPASPTIRILGSGFNQPSGVALDVSGNVYVSDSGNSAVKEILAVNGGIPASPAIVTLGSGFNTPYGVAVDSAGDVFVADSKNSALKEILAVNGSIPASPTIRTLESDTVAYYVAVDGSGDVYVTGYDGPVVELLAVNGSIPPSPTGRIIASSLNFSTGLAVDGSGNVFVANNQNSVSEIHAVNGSIPSSPTITTLSSAFDYPTGLGVDGEGNILVADAANGSVAKLDLADPPSLTFADTTAGSTSSDSPQTVTVENVGNAPLTFPIPSTGSNPGIAGNFTLNSSGASACPLVSAGSSEPGTLAAGASCLLPISFTPATAGALNGSLVLTDNNLNAAAPGFATQTIMLSGTGTQATPTITWPTPAAITYGTALSATQLDASANVPGTFSYSPAAGTVLTAGKQILSVTFTPTDTTDYTMATASVTLTVNQATPVITWPTPAAITYGTVLSATQLDAQASVSGTLIYSPVAGTVPAVGTDTLTVTFTPTDITDYTAATDSVLLKVNPAPSFTLSDSPGSLTVIQGKSGTSTVTVSGQNGFTGKVTLAASGLPSGVTAAFATNPTTGSSVLTLTASSSAATGTATVTIKGTSGSLTANTTIALTIGCAPTTITPYISVNKGSTWTKESTTTVSSTSTNVDLGPQPISGGSWSWTGPNDYKSTSRQINDIPLTVGTDSYVATYTNAKGCKSTETFTITVK